MANHAILGPSGAYRWIVCTPSARFEQQLPNEETAYAREGTLAHEVAALILATRAGTYTGTHANWLDDMDILEAEVDKFYAEQGTPSEFQAMLDHAEDYAQFILEHAPHDGDVLVGGEHLEKNFDEIAKHLLIENRYDVFKWVPLGFGTSDSTIRTKSVIYVGDYKYGAGVRVSAIANKQMMLYGLGALEQAKRDGWGDIHTVVMSIYQPRAGGSSSWQISTDKLLKWAEEEVKPKALDAIAGVGEFVAGSHCQFCRARNNCRAFFEKFAELKGISDKRVITPQQLQTVLTFGDAVSGWVKKMKDEAALKMQNGKKIEGFKLVAGRGRRSFKNEDFVVDELVGAGFEDWEIFEPQLRSLTTLEKILGKNKFNNLLGPHVVTVASKPQIAPEDDDRPTVGKMGADLYDEDEEEDILS